MIPSSVPRTNSRMLRIAGESGTCCSIWIQASKTAAKKPVKKASAKKAVKAVAEEVKAK